MITIIDRTVRLVAPGKGQVEEDVFRLKRDEHSNCIYTKVGVTNVNEYVNSFKESSSLQSILNRIQYMPVRDKIQYLNMQEAGVSADMSIFPNDPNEMFLIMKKFEGVLPNISQRLANGETLSTIINSFYSKSEKEVSVNGTNESSNDGSVAV